MRNSGFARINGTGKHRRTLSRNATGLMEQLEPRLMLSGDGLVSLIGPPSPDNSLSAPAVMLSSLQSQQDENPTTLIADQPKQLLEPTQQGEEKGSTLEPMSTFDPGEEEIEGWVQGAEGTWSNTSNYDVDDHSNAYSYINVDVPSGATITSVEYRIRVVHTYPGDLDIYVRSADGTEINVWNNLGGTDDGGYDDDSDSDEDVYLYYRSTSSFNGEDPDGSWRLRVYDNYNGDTGYIDYWYIRINYDTAPQYDPPGPDIENESVPSSITLGDWASVSFTLDDDDYGDVDEGYISVSFPDLDGYGDASYVYNNGSSSDLSYSEYDRGDSIWHKNNYQFSANYLLIDGYDSSWSSGEGNTLSFRVQPQSTGTFDMYVRGHLVGQDGNLYKDPNSSSYTDQQGWPVYRYTIQVNEPAKPDLDADINALNEPYNWGDFVGFEMSVTNEGNASSGTFGIDLVASNDSTLGDGDDIILDSWSTSLGAGSLWGQSYGYQLPTTPWWNWSDTVYFGLIADTVSGETDTGDNDDYDSVSLSAPPAPSPDLEWVSGIPATAYVGEPFTVTIQAENDANVGKLGSSITASVGHTSGTNGRVTVTGSKPSWADSDDWGWNLIAPGTGTIYHKDNGAMTPYDWFIEAAEDNWTAGESHQMSFTVTPDATGTIVIRTRTTMTNYQDWYNDTSASGGYEWVDQQGWDVREYAVNVEQRRPDLVADIDALNEPYHWGEGAGFEMSVVNEGNASSGGFWVDLVASNDTTIGDSDDVLIEDWYISNLNAGGGLWGQSWATTLPSSPWSGFNWDDTIYFGLEAYPASGETDTADNTDYDGVTVSPPLADLQGNTFDSTEPLLAGGSAELTYTIDNTGNGDADGFNVKFYISTDSTITTSDREIGYEWISGMVANTCTVPMTETVWLPGSTDSFWNGNGTYYIGMIVDPEGNVDEVTTSNNANRGNGIDRDAVTVNGASETGNVEYTLYRISDTSGTPHTSSPGSSRSTFLANETVRVTMRANNSGNAVDSEAVLNLLDPSGPPAFYDSYLVGDRPSEYLSTGETAYFSFDISLSGAATGWYDVLGSIRNDNDWDTVLDTTAPGRADADFENATLQDQFQVVHKPDLVADIDALNEPWQWGDTVGFEMQVTNEGSANASPFWVDLVMTDYNGDHVEILDSWYLSSGLSAGNLWGQSYAYTLPDVPPTGYEYSGDVYFWLMADVDEYNDDWYLGDNDDYDAVPMTLGQPDPDLVSVSTLPGSVEVGETITVTVLAENDGDDAGQNSSLSASVLYADGSDTAGNLVVTGPTNYGSVDYTALRTPGDVEPIYDSAGNAMTAQDWLVEIGDHNWTSGEQHAMTFTVTPQQAGQLVLRVRTTQTDAYGTPFTDHSVSGGVNGTDQQGYAVEEYVINVSQPFEVLDTSISTNTTRDGRTVTLGYRISSTTSQQVWLGATLTGPGGETIEDPDNDDTVTVSAGTNWYYRDFRVNMHPNPVSGYYDVTWGVHWGATGETYVTDPDALGIQSPIAVELPIIMYHKIDDVVRSQYYVDTDMFEAQMRALRAYGWDPISLDDLADMRAGIKSIPDKPIMITADDAYENWLTEATPVLQELDNEGWDIVMVGAIPTGRLGGTNAWDTGAIAEEGVAINHLTWSQVQQLHNTGLWDLQSHSHMHPDLTTLTPSQLEYEVTQSKSLLESYLNKDVDWMLYPFGAENLTVQEALHDADYFGAVNAWGGIEPNSYDKWTLDRIMIDDDDSVDWDPSHPENFFLNKIGENIVVPDIAVSSIEYLNPTSLTVLDPNEVAPGQSVLVRVHADVGSPGVSTTVSLNIDSDQNFDNGVMYDSHVEGEDIGMSLLPGSHTFEWTVDVPSGADLGQYYTAVGFHDVHYVLGFAYTGWQEGFEVAEHTPPEPEILQVVYPDRIVQGQWVDIDVQVTNNGPTATDGGVTISFPNFDTGLGDKAYIVDDGSDLDDLDGILVKAAGENIWHRDTGIGEFPADYLMAEWSDPEFTTGETNWVRLRVQPQGTDPFTFNVRSALGINYYYENTPDSGPTDQQGWEVQQYTIDIVQPPAPEILSVSYDSSINEGEWADIDITVRNNGGAGEDGGVTVSFPTLTANSDKYLVVDDGSDNDDLDGLLVKGYGETIFNAAGNGIGADYVMAEWSDPNFTTGETNVIRLRVKPDDDGNFTFYVRSALGINGQYWNDPGSSSQLDQQDWPVDVYTINVNASFNPHFFDARMVDPVDYNQNGYAQQRTLQVDVDSDEPGDYYLKIFEEGKATPLVETQDYHVDGYAYDWHDVSLAADTFGWSQGTVDLRIEMYDAATDALLGTRDASMDPSLNDVKFELASQDSPFTPYVTGVRIANGIDQDLDGHMHQYDVEFDVTTQVGSGSYYVKVYDWATKAPIDQTAPSTATFGSTDTVSLTVNVDDEGFRHSTRALKIELYKAGSDELVATHTSTQFTALAGIDVEPSADDVAEPGDTLSTARNLGNLNGSGLFTEREEIGDGAFGDKDIDLYRVRVTQEGDLTADVDARFIGLSDIDSYLRIFDSAGNQIASNDDKTTGDKDPLVTAFVQPGTYYIGVSARENRLYDPTVGGSAHSTPNNLGEYEVEISLASAQPPVGGEYQINEYITIYGEYELTTSGNIRTASGVVSVNNILTVYGSISFDNDLDVWGNGEVVLENLPVLGDMQLYEGEFEFNASDLITDTFNDYASALQVVGMDVHATSIRLVQDGVEVRGYINLPNVFTPNPDSDPIQLDIDGQQYVRINTDTGEVTYDMTLEVPEVKLVAGGLTFEAQDAAINLTNDPLLKATLTGTYMLDIPPYLDDLMVDLSVDQGRYLSFDENFDLEFNGAISADEIQIVQNVVYIEDLLIELDSVEQRYYGAGVIGLPIGDGVEIGAEVEFINGHLNTVGLVGNDLDIPVWGAPPIYLQRAGGSVSGLYTGPLVISPVLSLSAGPTIKGYSLLRLDGEVDIDLSGRVDGRVAVYVVGDEDNALANGNMRLIWDKSYGVYLSGALNAGFVDGEPTFTVNGQAALDNYGNFQGRLNGTAQIPSTVPVIGSILGGQQVSTTVYTQVYDDSDLDNDYLIGAIMIDLPIIGEVEHAIELNYNTGKIDWNASMDRVKTVTFPGVQDMAPAGMEASSQMIETFDVSTDVEWVIFRAGWETGDTDLTLVDPLGNTIDPTNVDTYANIEYVKSATEAYYVVASPASGPWVLDVTNEAGIGELTMEHLQHADSGTITMVQPATPQAGSPVLLEWTAEDSDSDAVISLYYDTDQTGADGTLIATGISEDNDPSSWSWDTSDVPAGDYYVYAVIDDAQEGVPGDVEYGHFTPKVSYAPGRITIADPQAPSQVTGVTTHGGTVDTDEGTATAEVVWSAATGDVDHYVVRYTDTASGEEYTSSRAATDTDITLTGLTPGETYRVEVSAVTVLRNVEGDIESIHTGPASDAIVLVAGNEATVSLGADEWDVFAPADQLYSAKVPGADGATYIPVNLPGGAQVTPAGQFEWYVPASGAEGWHEVLVHVTDPQTGITTAEQFWLLVDSEAPQWQSSSPTAEAVSATSVEISAPVAVDSSAGLAYRFERDGQVIGDWQLAPTFTDTALAPNASYDYRVQVRDTSTGELVSGWTDPVTATTLSAVASAPQLGEVGVGTIEVVSLAPDANPVGTEYALVNVTTGQYVAADGSASVTAVWQQSPDWSGVVVAGLQADTTYGLGVIARNSAGIASEMGEVAYVTTQLENVAPTVASVDVQWSTGNIRVEFTEAVDLDVKDIEITNRVTGETVDLSLASFIHEQGSNIVEINFNNALANGLYDLRLKGNSVQDLAANLLAGDGSTVGSDYVYQFHRVFCDANGDTRVDINDAIVWLNNYDPLGQNVNSPENGDWNGDGVVGMGDIILWQQNYDAIGLL